jgi:hypothetical protein
MKVVVVRERERECVCVCVLLMSGLDKKEIPEIDWRKDRPAKVGEGEKG